jgi:hypothetical protein
VAYGNKQVDFLLVLDDSNSMLPELKKLSSRLAGFVSTLEASQIDWQMCATTTRASMFGKDLIWQGPQTTVLKRGVSNLSNVFTATIDSIAIGGGDSGDERGIMAASASFKGGGSCYRPGAAVSVILISDEDERSVGGDIGRLKPQDAAGSFQALEGDDLPSTLMVTAKTKFGLDVRFTFNSIIVKPGDKSCEAEQDIDTSPSHPGAKYSEMSQLSQGGVGSICDADYSGSLNTFKDKVINSLSSLTLKCVPKSGTLKVLVNNVPELNLKLDNKILKFSKSLIEGTRIDLTYDCQD